MLELLLNERLIFGLLGGLGLFIYGMKTMSDGLQKIAGDRMRKILAVLTANRCIATLVGIGVTCLVQSSSATTVMVVGFVNAGLLSLMQAIGVVLGANIGTTITAQLIAFKIGKFALPAIGLGVALKLFARKKNKNYIGEVLLGFGMLFFGMTIMREAFDPLRGSEEFRNFFFLIGDKHLLGVAIGAGLTVLVQSSTATMGITLALASTGLLTYEAAVALILGENIGTTITANLAAIGTNLAARRTALAHFLFNFFGVAYMLVLFPYFIQFISLITPGDADFVIQTQQQAAAYNASIGDKPYIARHIANTHTMFNIINTIIFLPLIGVLAKVTTMLIRGTETQVEFQLKHIDARVLSTPPVALGQAQAETLRMAQLSRDLLAETLEFLEDGDEKRLPSLQHKEDLTDLLQKEITDFLVALSQQPIATETSREIAAMMHMVNDLERVGDHCENLWLLKLRKINEKTAFSETGDAELKEIGQKTLEFIGFVVAALERRDVTVREKARFMEDAIDVLEEKLRNNHIERLNSGVCSVTSGLIFTDMLHNFEKIGDHTYNVTKALVKTKK